MAEPRLNMTNHFEFEEATMGFITVFSSDDRAIEFLSEVKSMATIEEFKNQLIDLSKPDPAVAFSEGNLEDPNENRLTMNMYESEDEGASVRIFAEFDRSSKETFNQHLDDILRIALKMGEETIFENSMISFESDCAFESMEGLATFLNKTEYNVRGVRLNKEGIDYIIQRVNEESTIRAVLQENYEVVESEEDTILEYFIGILIPFMEEICYGTQKNK